MTNSSVRDSTINSFAKEDKIVGAEVIDNDQFQLDAPLTFCFMKNTASAIGKYKISVPDCHREPKFCI